jgi:pseudaminic acid cytidylyltransferase
MTGAVCVIPAWGGSKRIPRENIRPFQGRRMIGCSIAAARASGVFDRIVVSTNDPEIAAVARDQGAEVPFTRPFHLSGDRAVVSAIISVMGEDFVAA